VGADTFERTAGPFDPNFFQKFMSMSGMQGQSKEFSTDPITLEINRCQPEPRRISPER